MIIEHPNLYASSPSSGEIQSNLHPQVKIDENTEIKLSVTYDGSGSSMAQPALTSSNEIVIKCEPNREEGKYSSDYQTFHRQFFNSVIKHAQIFPASALLLHCCPHCCCSGDSGGNITHTLFVVENDSVSGFAQTIYAMKVDDMSEMVKLHVVKSFPLKCSGRVSTLSIDSKVSLHTYICTHTYIHL